MGQCYGQLSLDERIEIYRRRAAGESMRVIALTLERAVSTISREIRRNSLATKVWPGGYSPARAQKLAERRRHWDGRFKLARQPDLRGLVKDRLAMGHSPEQIAGRLALEHGHTVISHESIYRFIYHRSAQKGLLASPAAAPQTSARTPRPPRRQSRQLHQAASLNYRTPRRCRKP
jgi:IS30 family transposase